MPGRPTSDPDSQLTDTAVFGAMLMRGHLKIVPVKHSLAKVGTKARFTQLESIALSTSLYRALYLFVRRMILFENSATLSGSCSLCSVA